MIKSTERFVVYHVNSASGKPQWRAEIRGCDNKMIFMGYGAPDHKPHETPEAALKQAVEWANAN
mgnify:CR=1 FL=1